MLGFERRVRSSSLRELGALGLVGMESMLDSKQMERVSEIRRRWNFFEGYHWEEIDNLDKPEITTNYCRAFCNKFVAFELGKAFNFKLGTQENVVVTNDKRTLFKFLEDVWVDNNQYQFATEMGLMKSVTGDAWVRVYYIPVEDLHDPFGQYPNGRIVISLVSTGNVFPEYDPHNIDVLRKVTVMYPIEKVKKTLIGKESKERLMFRQVWTNDEIVEFEGEKEVARYANKYGTIPFVQIKNVSIPGRESGESDLEDIISLNVEYNMKCSDISEILDYHSAPVTVVYGAKIGSIEKGANKVWGGLAKDAKIENLTMQTDLGSSNAYIANLKLSMCEVAGIPETVLGGAQAISNTSGVALQFVNAPLIERTNVKKALTESGLETVNRLVLLIALTEGVITNPNGVPAREFFYTEVTVPDNLPKDMLLLVQQLQAEMALGIEDREGAMKRMGKENVELRLQEIDKDRAANPEIYMGSRLNKNGDKAELNSGFLNGETKTQKPNEQK